VGWRGQNLKGLKYLKVELKMTYLEGSARCYSQGISRNDSLIFSVQNSTKLVGCGLRANPLAWKLLA